MEIGETIGILILVDENTPTIIIGCFSAIICMNRDASKAIRTTNRRSRSYCSSLISTCKTRYSILSMALCWPIVRTNVSIFKHAQNAFLLFTLFDDCLF